MAKGYIRLKLIRVDGKGTLIFNVRPELISMFREEDDTTLIWIDPHDAPFIADMCISEFEHELQRQELNY